jgi:hypothetical protein
MMGIIGGLADAIAARRRTLAVSMLCALRPCRMPPAPWITIKTRSAICRQYQHETFAEIGGPDLMLQQCPASFDGCDGVSRVAFAMRKPLVTPKA